MAVAAGIGRLRAAIDARNLRERILLLAAVVVVLVLVWDVALRAPIAERQRAAEERQEQLANEQQELRATIDSLESEIADAESDDGAERRAALESELESVDRELSERTARVVSPEQMVAVVRDMVTAEEELALETLANTGAEEIIVEDGADDGGEDVPRVYRHRVELVVTGEFFAILGYLENLEALDWEFQWDALRLETVDYPQARVTVQLSTLSLDEDWIGV